MSPNGMKSELDEILLQSLLALPDGDVTIADGFYMSELVYNES